MREQCLGHAQPGHAAEQQDNQWHSQEGIIQGQGQGQVYVHLAVSLSSKYSIEDVTLVIIGCRMH